MADESRAFGVLIIDDDLVVRDVLRACLVGVDQDVYQAANGMEALSLAARVEAALVICDINMPKMNGLMVCEQLRRLPGYGRTPIVMLTSLDDERVREAAGKVGATAFLTKPFRPVDVVDVVARFLPIPPAMLAALRRENERASAIANVAPRPTPFRNQPSSPETAPNRFDRGKRLLNILRG